MYFDAVKRQKGRVFSQIRENTRPKSSNIYFLLLNNCRKSGIIVEELVKCLILKGEGFYEESNSTCNDYNGNINIGMRKETSEG